MIMFYPTNKTFDYYAYTNTHGNATSVFSHQIDEDCGVIIAASDTPTIQSFNDLPELTLSLSHDNNEAQHMERLLLYVRAAVSADNPDGVEFLKNYRDIFQRKLIDGRKSWVLKSVAIGERGILLQYGKGLSMWLCLPANDHELILGIPAHGNHEASKIAIQHMAGDGAIQKTYIISINDDPSSMIIDIFGADANNPDKPAMEVACSYPTEMAEQIFQDYHQRITGKSCSDSRGIVFYCY